MPASTCLWVSFAVAQAAGHLAKDGQKVTPVEKVVDLLKKLGDQVSEEGKNEAAEYDKYACFCKEQASNKLYAIDKSKEKIEEMTAEIEELEAQISDLDGSIQELTERLGAIKTKMEKNKEKRDKQHETYLDEEKDVSGAIKAVKAAIKALKNAKKEMKGDTDLDLLQQIKPVADQLLAVLSRAHRGSGSDKQLNMVLALAQQAQHGVPASGKSHDYEFRSNDIIETLKGLFKEFNLEKKELDEKEFDANVAYDKERLDLFNENKFKSEEKASKETRVEKLSEDVHTTKSNKDDETNAKESDEAFMKVLTEQCEDKSKIWDQRSKARAGELTALAEATSILEEGVKGNYEANEKLVGFVSTHQQLKPASFLQLKDSNRAVERKLLSLLNAKATKLHSVALAGLVSKVVLTDDHFVKVRGIIKDLIEKLEADADAEATQKSFCDKEMKKAVSTRDEQTLEIETESATISQKKTEREKLLGEIDQLTQEIADAFKSLNEASELREEEKAANEKTIEMSKGGKEAIESAISVLKDFYGSAFVQVGYTPPNSDRDGNTVGDLAPKTSFDDEYKGNQGASKGILGMMEVILSDFERTTKTVTEDEETADKAFKKFEKETKKEIEDKKDEKSNKESDVANAEDAITEAKDDLNEATNLKTGALEELSKLKPMCVDGGESYAERKKKRVEEIEALKEAMKILDEWQN